MTSRSLRTPTIGYITPSIYSSYFRLLLAGVQRATQDRSAGLIVLQMTPQAAAESRLAWDRVDGWVACYSDANTAGFDLLARSGRPLVMISQPVDNVPLVVTENAGGMRAVIRHLLNLGHRKIAFVGWEGNPDIADRLAGYRAELEEGGISFDPSLVYTLTSGGSEQGIEFGRQLAAEGLPCTAIAFANDYLALGAMRSFQQAGIRIPNHVAITGFDDMPESQIAVPPLTTVRMRFDAISRAATEHVLDIIAGATPARSPIVIPASLVVRRSAGEKSELVEAGQIGSGDRATLARRMAETVGAPELLAEGEPPGRLWPGVNTIVDAVEAALHNGTSPDDGALQQAWASAVAVTSYADPLEDAVGHIEAVLAAGLAVGDALDGQRAVHRLRTMLLRACVGGQVERINRTEAALSFSNSAARTLADNDAQDISGLSLLERSGVVGGALGLWDEGETSGRLRMAGCYPATAGPIGAVVDASSFPPAEMVATASRAPMTVLPLRSTRRGWGFLALAFPFSLESAVFDSGPLLAALLTARIDSLALQQERDEQQAALRIAFERERALADTVRQLGCPVIPLSTSTLLVPLIGVIDSQRAQQIIGMLLHAAETQRAKTILLDLTGVPLIDTHVAGMLVRLAQMLRLLGAHTALVGIRPEIAHSIVSLGVDLSGLTSYASLMAALAAMR
jgi:anti-anti-sigma factor